MLRLLLGALALGLCQSAWAERRAGRVEILEHSSPSPHATLGPSEAPVTIEFFLNLTLGGQSMRASALLEQLHANHPQRVRIIYRLTPKRAFANDALRFAQEALEQGRFFEFMEAYYGKTRRHPTAKSFPEVAEKAGLDFARVSAVLAFPFQRPILTENYYYWKRAGSPRLPSVLINGKSTRIASPSQLEALYDQAYSDSTDLLDQGVALSNLYTHQLARKDPLKPRKPDMARGVDSLDPNEDAPITPTDVRMSALLQGEHRRGPKDAPLILVFICHVQSSYCRIMARELSLLRETYSKEIQVIFHPLFDPDRVGQERSGFLHEAALCADEQDAFFDFLDHAYLEQRKMSNHLEHSNEKLAAEIAASPWLTLNSKLFEECLNSGRQKAKLQNELKIAREAGVSHTPALAINGVLHYGRRHFPQLQELVEEELRPGLIRRLSGP